jgi:cytoskeletal protein RodZ
MTTDSQQTDSTEETIEAGDLTKLLQQYRNIAHLDIDQIADSLCLTSSAINALENEDFNKLPESPYVRGYLRNYARLANQDPRHIIKIYNTLKGEPNEEEHPHSGILASGSSYQEVTNPLITPQRFRLALLTGLLLFLGLLTMIPAVKDWASNLWTSFSTPSEIVDSENNSATENPLNLPSLTDEVPGNLPISPEETEKTADEAESAEPETAGTSTADESQEESANTSAEDAVNQTPDTNVQETPANDSNDAENTAESNEQPEAREPTAEGNTKLKFVFTDEVWLRIKGADGSVLYEALHPAGTEKELSLNSPLKFKVGNAPSMQLFVNGKAMDTAAYTKGSVAKFDIK